MSGHTASMKREYDKGAKTFVLYCEGGSRASMQLPKRGVLGVAHRYVVFQMYVGRRATRRNSLAEGGSGGGESASCTLELVVGVRDGGKLRLIISTKIRHVAVNLMHAQLPLVVKRETWVSLVIDLRSLVEDNYPELEYDSLEKIILKPHCRIQRIFASHAPLEDTSDDAQVYPDWSPLTEGETVDIPRKYALKTPNPVTQVLDMPKILAASPSQPASLPPPSRSPSSSPKRISPGRKGANARVRPQTGRARGPSDRVSSNPETSFVRGASNPNLRLLGVRRASVAEDRVSRNKGSTNKVANGGGGGGGSGRRGKPRPATGTTRRAPHSGFSGTRSPPNVARLARRNSRDVGGAGGSSTLSSSSSMATASLRVSSSPLTISSSSPQTGGSVAALHSPELGPGRVGGTALPRSPGGGIVGSIVYPRSGLDTSRSIEDDASVLFESMASSIGRGFNPMTDPSSSVDSTGTQGVATPSSEEDNFYTKIPEGLYDFNEERVRDVGVGVGVGGGVGVG